MAIDRETIVSPIKRVRVIRLSQKSFKFGEELDRAMAEREQFEPSEWLR